MIKTEASIIDGALKGFLIASIASLIVLSALVISLNETGQPSAVNIPTLPVQLAFATPLPPLAIPTTSPTLTPTSFATPTTMASPTPTPCSPPEDWIEYQVQEGDKLNALARALQIDREALLVGNCTDKLVLEPGMIILIPPSQLPTAVACQPATGWSRYIVKPGDTLYSLAKLINSTVTIIQAGNCLTTERIYVGQMILLPRLPPPSYPTATPTMTPLPTHTPQPPTDTVGPISRGTATPTPAHES